MSAGAKITVVFVVGLVLLAVAGGVFCVSTQRMIEAERWVDHTREVEKTLDDLLLAHVNAETGQRGFLITGKDRYLEPYHSGVSHIRQDLDAVASLTRDNPSQQESLQRVRKLSDAKLAELQETIRLEREAGFERARPEVLTDRGRKIMDDLRGVVGEMMGREEELLTARKAAAAASASHAIWTIVLWMPLALVVLTVAALILMRSVRLGGGPAMPSTGGKGWAGIAFRYGSAVVIVAVAAALQRRLAASFGPLPTFITFYPAVLLVASVGGGGPGVLATVLSTLAADYWFIPPVGSFRIDAPSDVLALGIFGGSCLFLCVLAERLRRARWAEALGLAQQERAEQLSRQNDELTRQSEELSQQAEELSQQAEELSQQSEELSGQNEELQAQSEEIQALNEELGHREVLLQSLLEAARQAGSQQDAMQKVCDATLRMFGEAAAAVMVYDKQGEQLVVRASSALGNVETAPQSLPAEHAFSELVIQQNRTACLNDAALRLDLAMMRIPGLEPFQAVLAAPLQRAGLAFGAVAIYSVKPRAWTAEQFRLAEWLAAQCAQILETLRMQQELARVASFPTVNPQPIVEADLDGRVTFANPAAQQIFPDLHERGADHPWLIDWQALGEACRTGTSMSSREVMVEDRVYHQTIHFMPQTGRIRTYGLDITERKRAEEALQAAWNSAEQAKAVAELANRAKDHFLAVLSHELRTPLTPVVMGVSMLQEKPGLDPDVSETLEMVRRNVEMEARLIDDLLDVMRIARGKIDLIRSPVEVCKVILGAVAVCKPDLEARGLRFCLDLGPAAPYWIEADASRLQQVFWNLLKNAIKFTPHGGRVDVRCRPEGAYVVVEVIDSGIGIEPESLPRIFNAFEQAERSITRQFGGLGLGLTISKALVELHGGTIEAHSQGRNKGATFRIRLPLTTPAGQPQAPAAAAPRARPARPLRILLVEDHGVSANMLRVVLAADGHEVAMAGDVATALELADQQVFDLLISDLGLPDGSGHDLMRLLRQRGHTLPGIALSGYGQEEDLRRSREAGFAAHLTKPASRVLLVEAIATVTAG
jgi:signal transduction histidine kinase/CHASE3 domain sensor protein/DNA-binding transcriptional MerR regulator